MAKQAYIGILRRASFSFLALLFASVFTAPASAYETHYPLPFSPMTGAGSGVTIEVAGGLAVDEPSGNVFLGEPLGLGLSKVDIFGAEGGPPVALVSPFQIVGLNVIDARTFPESLKFSHIAIDNSAESPNQGTLYVSEQGAASARKVRKFARSPVSEKYEPAGELKASFPIENVKKGFEAPTGIAVDTNGNVFVADSGSTISAIAKFNPSGEHVQTISTSNLETTIPGGTGSNPYVPNSLAVDSAGDLFVRVMREDNPGNPFTKVVKYLADGSGEIDEDVHEIFYEGGPSNEGPKDAYALAVDPSTDTLYVALKDIVIQYDAITLEEEGRFGPGAFAPNVRIAGMAVNGATGRIYVSENGPFHGGPHHIHVFGPAVKLPTITPQPPTRVVGSVATLNALIDPEGIEVSDCKFEWGTTDSYGNTAPCEELSPMGNDEQGVKANITGLTPNGVTYHWRMVASNVNGTNDFMEDQTFQSGPPVITDPASDVSGARATLNGTVLPQNQVVTECKFEYLGNAEFKANENATDYGFNGPNPPLSVPCLESVPTDDSEHPVSAKIDGLLANGAIYHFRVATDGGAGPLEGNVETFATAETFVTDPASVVGTTATLNGTVNLEELPLTDCKFEYGLTEFLGESVPCAPPFASIPNDSNDHVVTAVLSDLEPNAVYHFRLFAKNALGDIPATALTFRTTGAPLIAEQSAAPLGTDKAILSGWINPVGFDASYHFEWGVDSSYGQRVPAEPDPSIGSGSTPVAVSQELVGLEGDITYHYRIVAESSAGMTEGPDQTFTTDRSGAACTNAGLRAGQVSAANPSGTAYLPACMALEMVSPPKKFNQRVDSPDFSLSGDALQFISLAALAETPQQGSQNDPYVATRTASGWATHAVQPSLDISYGDAPPCSYDLDLERWSLLARPGVGAVELGVAQPMSGTLGGGFSPLGPTVSPLNTTFSYAGCEASVGGSSDGSALFFRSEGAAYLPGDPITTGLRNNTYVAHLDANGEPSVELLSRDASGIVHGGTCGADVGWVGLGGRHAARGAISPDGSRVYFTTRPDQGPGACKPADNKMRIMMRVETPSGPEIGELVSSECTRVAPACSSSGGDDNFVAASQEGGKVFFTTGRQLVNGDLDASIDLYLHDASRPAGSRLILVSAGDDTNPAPGNGAKVSGVGEVSGDGSRVYFVADGLLTTNPNAQGGQAEVGKPNLYLYQRDATFPDGRTSFIATLATGEGSFANGPGETGMAAVPRLGSDVNNLSVGGDGHVLFFSSRAPLTPSDADGKLDGFRYDAESGSLQRITRAAPGGGEGGSFDANGMFSTGDGRAPQDVSFGRTVSEDGRTAVFMSAEGLDPADIDGAPTVYIWRDGRIAAIAGSLASSQGETFTVSTSGRAVAFVTDQKLLSTDSDGSKDIYVAWSDGGFPSPPSGPTCHGEECRPQGGQPESESPPSMSFAGPGNLTAPPKKCRKGFVRKKGKCVKKHASKKPKHAKKGAKKKPKRQADKNRGAGK